ncbi:hypothetical protein [Nocardia asiatica]|uniref:hypothetical protein n=1 Tax=Nocardia asiatica TaxID=209252 RepID=UPI0024565D52|nr:hypothetical protein [Nocardia asiatica]
MAEENSPPEPPSEDRPEQFESSEGAPLTKLERAAALTFGTGFGGSGVAAVFLSDNQAGTAALFLLAAVLLLIGVQGTPLTRFGSGENNAEFARKTAGRLLRQASQQEDPRVAEGVVQAAAIVLEPSVARHIEDRISPREYEYEVLAALRRVAGPQQIQAHGSDRSVDFAIDLPSGTVAVEVKLAVGHANIPAVVAQIAALSQTAHSFDKALVVVRNTLPTALARLRDELKNLQHPGECEVVHWRSEEDDEALRRALAQLQ